ncbi:MAG: PKD domain-containing protein, partial [Myxococcota bacterium]
MSFSSWIAVCALLFAVACGPESSGINGRPVASVTAPVNAEIGSAVPIDGSLSYDPDDDPLTYAWELTAPEASAATLANAIGPGPTFVPDAAGIYSVTLVVDDGVASSLPATATVVVESDNTPPVVDAGPDAAANIGDVLSLQGSASDADEDPLTYRWEILSGPEGHSGVLSFATSLDGTFASGLAGSYVLELTVDDGEAQVTDTVNIEVTGELDVLHYRVVDAEYSTALDRVVLVSAQPDELHIYDPSTAVERTVALPLAPTAVSIGRAGNRAAVGHDGYVTIVDLDDASVVVTHPVSTDVIDVVLADNGYVYGFPRIDQWETIRTVNIATGEETESTGWSIRAGTYARL